MAVRQFVGARYVPKFSEPLAWSSDRTYEALEVVMHQGASFVSKQPVPVGVEITNESFWLPAYDYNAQFEQLRETVAENTETVQTFDRRITANDERITENGETIARDRIASQLQMMDFAPYTRYIWENTGGEWLGAQASTMDEDERYFYVVTPYAASDPATDVESYLRVIDPQSGTMLNGVELEVGHGRSLTAKGNYLLTSNKYAEAGNTWLVIDISNRTQPVEVQRGQFNGRHIFWTDEGAACCTGANTIKFFDVEYNQQGVPVAFIENERTIQYTRGIRGEEQTFQYWNGFIIISSTSPETITVIDAETGETVAQNLLKAHYSYLNTSECESAFIINGHLYFSNTGRAPLTASLEPQIECSLFRCDFLSPKGEFYDYWRRTEDQKNKSVEMSVSGSKPAISSVSADGSAERPYWFVEDCIYAYDTQQRMRFTHTSPRLGLSIKFTQAEYPYIATLRNFREYTVNLNGYGASGITELPFIHIYNATATLNRLKLAGLVYRDITTLSQKVGVYARQSNVVVQNCEFLEDTENDFSLYEIDSSISVRQVISHVRANGGEIIAQEFTATPMLSNGGIAQTYGLVSPLAGNSIVNFSAAGNTATQTNWINFLRVDGSIYRLFFTATEIEYRYYPDYHNLNTYTTIWRMQAQA